MEVGDRWGKFRRGAVEIMKLLSIKDLAAEVAKQTGLESMSASRMRVLVVRWASEIGAVKVGHSWVIPESAIGILAKKINISKRPKVGDNAPKRKEPW